MRYFGLVPGLLAGGLLLDAWQARAPRRGLTYLQRASVCWALLFPLARLGQDLLAFAYYHTLDPATELAEIFPAFGGLGPLVGFLMVQGIFGAVFGLGWGMIARRIALLVERRDRRPPA